MVEGLQRIGAPQDVIKAAEEKASQPTENEDFGVFEDNWQALLFFIDLRTQWNVVVLPSGRIKHMGLKWSEAERLMDIRRIPKKERTALWDDLLMMELEALEVLNQAR